MSRPFRYSLPTVLILGQMAFASLAVPHAAQAGSVDDFYTARFDAYMTTINGFKQKTERSFFIHKTIHTQCVDAAQGLIKMEEESAALSPDLRDKIARESARVKRDGLERTCPSEHVYPDKMLNEALPILEDIGQNANDLLTFDKRKNSTPFGSPACQRIADRYEDNLKELARRGFSPKQIEGIAELATEGRDNRRNGNATALFCGATTKQHAPSPPLGNKQLTPGDFLPK